MHVAIQKESQIWIQQPRTAHQKEGIVFRTNLKKMKEEKSKPITSVSCRIIRGNPGGH